jgi:large subunit ribosomal protein L6
MSRIAKQAITLPKGVTATISAESVTVKGAKGSMSLNLRPGVAVVQEGDVLKVQQVVENKATNMDAGSTRAHLANYVVGVSAGLNASWNWGVGYRAAAQGKA